MFYHSQISRCSVSRRLPVMLVLLSAFAFTPSSVFGEQVDATSSPARPNIVFAFADDWGKFASVYGQLEPGGPSDVVSTPHFDSIAKRGVLFTRAFVSAPSCTPCRSSLVSGQHFWQCGRASILQGAVWDFSNPAYPLLMEEAGYRIGHTYKVWSPGKPANAPHGGKRTAFNSKGRRFNGFSQNASRTDEKRATKEDLLQEVRGNVRSFLDADQNASLDGEKPFCYWFGPTNCHRKWIAGSGKALWGINPDDLKGKLPPYLPDVPSIRQDFADYLGEAQAFDASLGVIEEELRRIGQWENTLLVISGDHGVPGVPRGKCNLYDLGTAVPLAIHWPEGIKHPGRVVDDFVSLPDLAPTFLEAADISVPEAMTARTLMPQLESDRSGQIDPKRDAVFTGRERHVALARAGNLPYPQRAIRTDRFLYIINFEPDRYPMGDGPGFGQPAGPMPSTEELTERTFAAFADLDGSPTKAFIAKHPEEYPMAFEIAFDKRPREELYDILADSNCMKNLAQDPEFATTRKELETRLMNELRRTGDPRLIKPVVYESMPYTTPR
ncbi:MAG: sulfatase [Planctomycetota bacterium]